MNLNTTSDIYSPVLDDTSTYIDTNNITFPIKCPCTNWDKTMFFDTKTFYYKVSGGNDIDKINRGLDKINDKYEKIFDPKKEKCTSEKAFEDPGVIAALILIPIAAYVGGGFTLKQYILPGLKFIWSKLSGTPAAAPAAPPAAPVRTAARGGGGLVP